MYTFNILIENLEKRLNQSRALHIMAGLLVLVYGLRGFSNLPATSLQLYTGLPAALIILYISIFKKQYLQNIFKNRNLRIIEAVFICLAAFHFIQYKFTLVGISFIIAALGILFSIVIDNQILGGYIITVDQEGIKRPGNAKQNVMTWNTVANALVKNNVLTVDLTNNYLMQSTFTNTMHVDAILEFNNFCQRQINKHKSH